MLPAAEDIVTGQVSIDVQRRPADGRAVGTQMVRRGRAEAACARLYPRPGGRRTHMDNGYRNAWPRPALRC
jgi:hypothetical protein